MSSRTRVALLSIATLLAASCTGSSGSGAGLDAGAPQLDAGAPGLDAGALDAGAPGLDAGALDAGAPQLDAGAPQLDAGVSGLDAGAPQLDAGALDAGAPDAGTVPGTWVRIAAGTFTMGSPVAEVGRWPNEGQHEVTLTRGFMMLSTEVTQADFASVMGYNRSRFTACGGDCPMERVTWQESAAYANALSDRAGLGRCYGCTGSGPSVTCAPSAAWATPYDCPGYRHPTEAEWERAYRAGTTTAFYDGAITATGCSDPNLDVIAWYCGNASGTTHAVARKAPNAWGLYDMSGNVGEWVWDWYASYPAGPVTDPAGPRTGSNRVTRGGSWSYVARGARAAYRVDYRFRGRGDALGFRLARSLP